MLTDVAFEDSPHGKGIARKRTRCDLLTISLLTSSRVQRVRANERGVQSLVRQTIAGLVEADLKVCVKFIRAAVSLLGLGPVVNRKMSFLAYGLPCVFLAWPPAVGIVSVLRALPLSPVLSGSPTRAPALFFSKAVCPRCVLLEVSRLAAQD